MTTNIGAYIKRGLKNSLTDEQKVRIFDLVRDKIDPNGITENELDYDITFDLSKLDDETLVQLFDIINDI